MEIKQFPKITVILRGYTYEQVRCVVKNLVGTRLNAVEITTNSPDVFTTIHKISEEFGKDVYVGAGKVLNMEHAKAAVEAGSTFLLSPIMLEDGTGRRRHRENLPGGAGRQPVFCRCAGPLRKAAAYGGRRGKRRERPGVSGHGRLVCGHRVRHF